MNFDFKADYVLENEVVRLRPLTENDFEYLLEYSLNEPSIWFYSILGADGSANLKIYIDTALKGRQDELEYPFIVFDKRVGKYIGSTRFYDIQLKNKSLQLGYTWYGQQFQRTGINRHCKLLLLQFAFEQLQMERVEFRANAKNARSIEAMKQIGCSVEGILRKNILSPDGTRRDTIVLSILKEEWEYEVKSHLIKKIKTV